MKEEVQKSLYLDENGFTWVDDDRNDGNDDDDGDSDNECPVLDIITPSYNDLIHTENLELSLFLFLTHFTLKSLLRNCS